LRNEDVALSTPVAIARAAKICVARTVLHAPQVKRQESDRDKKENAGKLELSFASAVAFVSSLSLERV
jgi:hypothetical protein